MNEILRLLRSYKANEITEDRLTEALDALNVHGAFTHDGLVWTGFDYNNQVWIRLGPGL